MSKILYYPYIELPEEQWTVNSLLYWDEVGTIYPDSADKYTDSLDETTKFFFEEGLLKKVNPQNFGHSPEWFQRKVLEEVQNPTFNLEEKRKLFLGKMTTICYTDKFDKELFLACEDLGLAKRENEDQFRVELTTANMLIFLLATEISKSSDFIASTDDEHYLSRDFFNLKENMELRHEILNSILPSALEIEPKKLLEFKAEYNPILIKFREHIELTVDTLQAISNKPIYEALKKRHLAQLQDQSNEILARMTECRLGRIFKSTWFGATLSTMAHIATSSPVPLITGAIGAVKSAVGASKSPIPPPNPLVYIGLLSQNFQ